MTASDQLSLFPTAPREPKRPRADIGDGRRSINSMVDLALARGTASSVPDLLRQVGRLHDQALFNALLAVLQFPEAALLLTQEQWERDWGRRVRPTEHPIVLQWPYAPVIFLFDVAQTEETSRSKPLPRELRNPWHMTDAPHASTTLANVAAEVCEHGVKVEFGSHGWALAGKMRRVHNEGVLKPANGDARRPLKTIPVRWRTHINTALTPTEQLMTLAHELGHLFCGHVGADKGDPWENREGCTSDTEEFEAESVAVLVMERLTPGLTLPDATLRKLQPAAGLPPHDWTLVVRAAERILKAATAK